MEDSSPGACPLLNFLVSQNYASLALSTSQGHPNDVTATDQIYVFIHGWVYDLENGEVTDLNVTVGPPGHEISKSPWPCPEDKKREKMQN